MKMLRKFHVKFINSVKSLNPDIKPLSIYDCKQYFTICWRNIVQISIAERLFHFLLEFNKRPKYKHKFTNNEIRKIYIKYIKDHKKHKKSEFHKCFKYTRIYREKINTIDRESLQKSSKNIKVPSSHSDPFSYGEILEYFATAFIRIFTDFLVLFLVDIHGLTLYTCTNKKKSYCTNRQ